MKETLTGITPYKINVQQELLDDLQARLRNTRWPGELQDAEWNYGSNLSYMKELVDYWQHGYDWRATEMMLNGFEQYRAEIDDIEIHFLHVKGHGHDCIPLLLLHGFPDSFARMLKIIPLLSNPGANDGDSIQSFDLIIPSLPGFGFSDKPSKPGFDVRKVAHVMNKLMTDLLEYDQFAVHGGDWGSSIVEQLAIHHKGSLLGIHVTDIPYWRMFAMKADELTGAEKDYMKRGQLFQMTLGGYAMIQSQRPQNLSYAMNDSPAGLAAYIVDMFRTWSDCDGDIEKRFTKDELLTHIMIYWVTQTFESAIRYYYEAAKVDHSKDAAKIEVPTGVAVFPKDLVPPPKEVGERFYNIKSWTEMPRGGHFAAMEEPKLLADDITEFFFNVARGVES